MSRYAVSALTVLAGLIIGLVIIRLTPKRAGAPRLDVDAILARNADLERRITELEERVTAIGSRGSAGV